MGKDHAKLKASPRGKRKLDFPKKKSVKLPLIGKLLYLDIKELKILKRIRNDLHRLGGTVEDFLSKDINYVITSQPCTSRSDKNKKDGPQSPAVPSPFNCEPSPSPSNPEERKIPTVTRGKALAEKARQRSSANTIVLNAEKWGVKVVSLDAAYKWIEREMKKVPRQSPKVTKGTAVRSIARYRTFKAPFLKIEDTGCLYRPFTSQLETWPRINVDTQRGSCPFDGVHIASGQKSVEERGDILPAQVDILMSDTPKEEKDGLVDSTGNPGSAQPEKVSKKTDGEQTCGTFSVLTAGEVRRRKEIKRRQERKRGYCELCQLKYEDMDKHVQDDQHRAYIKDKSTFQQLDKLILSRPSIAYFLKNVFMKSLTQDHRKNREAQGYLTEDSLAEEGECSEATATSKPSKTVKLASKTAQPESKDNNSPTIKRDSQNISTTKKSKTENTVTKQADITRSPRKADTNRSPQVRSPRRCTAKPRSKAEQETKEEGKDFQCDKKVVNVNASEVVDDKKLTNNEISSSQNIVAQKPRDSLGKILRGSPEEGSTSNTVFKRCSPLKSRRETNVPVNARKTSDCSPTVQQLRHKERPVSTPDNSVCVTPLKSGSTCRSPRRRLQNENTVSNKTAILQSPQRKKQVKVKDDVIDIKIVDRFENKEMCDENIDSTASPSSKVSTRASEVIKKIDSSNPFCDPTVNPVLCKVKNSESVDMTDRGHKEKRKGTCASENIIGGTSTPVKEAMDASMVVRETVESEYNITNQMNQSFGSYEQSFTKSLAERVKERSLGRRPSVELCYNESVLSQTQQRSRSNSASSVRSESGRESKHRSTHTVVSLAKVRNTLQVEKESRSDNQKNEMTNSSVKKAKTRKWRQPLSNKDKDKSETKVNLSASQKDAAIAASQRSNKESNTTKTSNNNVTDSSRCLTNPGQAVSVSKELLNLKDYWSEANQDVNAARRVRSLDRKERATPSEVDSKQNHKQESSTKRHSKGNLVPNSFNRDLESMRDGVSKNVSATKTGSTDLHCVSETSKVLTERLRFRQTGSGNKTHDDSEQTLKKYEAQSAEIDSKSQNKGQKHERHHSPVFLSSPRQKQQKGEDRQKRNPSPIIGRLREKIKNIPRTRDEHEIENNKQSSTNEACLIPHRKNSENVVSPTVTSSPHSGYGNTPRSGKRQKRAKWMSKIRKTSNDDSTDLQPRTGKLSHLKYSDEEINYLHSSPANSTSSEKDVKYKPDRGRGSNHTKLQMVTQSNSRDRTKHRRPSIDTDSGYKQKQKCVGNTEISSKEELHNNAEISSQSKGVNASDSSKIRRKVKLSESWSLLSHRSLNKLLNCEDNNDGGSFDGFSDVDQKSLVSDLSYEEKSEVSFTSTETYDWDLEVNAMATNHTADVDTVKELKEAVFTCDKPVVKDQEFDKFLPRLMSSPGKSNSSWDEACAKYISNSLCQKSEPQSSFHHARLTSPSRKASNSSSCFSPGFITPKKRKKGKRVDNTTLAEEQVDREIVFNFQSPQKLNTQFSPLKSCQEEEMDVSSPMSGQRSQLLVTSTPLGVGVNKLDSYYRKTKESPSFSPARRDSKGKLAGREKSLKHEKQRKDVY